MKKKRMFALLLAGCCLLTGCSGASQEGDPAGESPEARQSGLVQSAEPSQGTETDAAYIDSVSMEAEVSLEEELVPMSSAPAVAGILSPVASGAAALRSTTPTPRTATSCAGSPPPTASA